jgi:hypothetical protein
MKLLTTILAGKILIGLLLPSGALRAAEDPRVFVYPDTNGVLRIETVPHSGEDKVLSSLAPDERTELLRRLHAQLGSPDQDTRIWTGRSLLRLDDEEGIAQLAKNYRAGDLAADQSLDEARESAVRYLIDGVYNGSDEPRGKSHDWEGPSTKRKSTELTLEAIKRSTAFPAATRAWAREAFDAYHWGSHRVDQRLKAWWEHNQEAILAKEYGKATWLPAGKFDPATDEIPDPLSIRGASPASASSSATPAAPPLAVTSSPLPWVIGALAVLALAGAAALRLRRK